MQNTFRVSLPHIILQTIVFVSLTCCEHVSRLFAATFIISLQDKWTCIMWPFLRVYHHGIDINFMYFMYMSLKIHHNFCIIISLYEYKSKTILFHIKQRFFKLCYKAVGLMVELLQTIIKILIEQRRQYSIIFE